MQQQQKEMAFLRLVSPGAATATDGVTIFFVIFSHRPLKSNDLF